MTLKFLKFGQECVFDSRFIKGGSITDFNWERKFFSKTGRFFQTYY
jgi:hypothetical protein